LNIILRGQSPFFFIVQNELKIVVFVITLAFGFSSILWYPFGRRFGNLGECNGIYKNLHFFRLLFLIPKQNTQKPNTQKMKKLTYLLLALMISPTAKARFSYPALARYLLILVFFIYSKISEAQLVSVTISPANTGRVTGIAIGLNCTTSCSAGASGFATILFTPLAEHAYTNVTGYRVTNSSGSQSAINTTSGVLNSLDWYYGGQLTANFYAAPSEIDLRGNGVSIPDGDVSPTVVDNTHFGVQLVSSGITTRTFTIANTGVGAVGLSGTPKVVISGSHAADFTVSTQPSPDVVVGNSSTTFVVSFDPSAAGSRTAMISITNSDTNEGTYNFNIEGTGVTALPAINLKGNGVTIANNDNSPSTSDDTDFGSKALSSGAVTKIFTIENTGTGSLDLSPSPSVVISGTNSADFAVTAQPTSPVAANGSRTFQVSFTPTATGTRNASVNIYSYNPDKHPYVFSIRGTGTAVVPPTITAGAVTNAATCGGATGNIAFTATNVPNGTYSLTFTTTGTSSPQNVTVSNNAFTLSSLTAGSYNNFSLTVSGQTATTGVLSPAKIVSNPAAPTLTVGTSTNPTTCAGTNGNIAFTSTNLPNGTYSLSFTATGVGATTSPQNVMVTSNAFSLISLKAGAYSNFSVTNNGCTGTVATSRTLADPAAPTLTVGTATNPTTCAGTNGSIAFTSTNLPNGTYSLSFTATGAGATTSPKNVTVSGNSFSLIGLSVGSYSGFSLTSTGCAASDVSSKSITNPTTPTLTPGVAVNPTSCGGTNSSIPFTTNLPDGTYSLSYTGTGSPKSINVSSGAFTLGTLGSGGMAISR
jgi:hypothetical protein